MDTTASGTKPIRRRPAKWFTGTVRQGLVVEAPAPVRIRAARLSFEPGARTAWHAHPLGQTLRVLNGVGRAQTGDSPGREIQPGNTAWIPPGERQWHGRHQPRALYIWPSEKMAWVKKCHVQVTLEIHRAVMAKGFRVLDVRLI